jgi:hypothetical protein
MLLLESYSWLISFETSASGSSVHLLTVIVSRSHDGGEWLSQCVSDLMTDVHTCRVESSHIELGVEKYLCGGQRL